jgi:hypothetical protein
MRGIFSRLPADTLAAALAPVADRCSPMAWAVRIQSGLLRNSSDEEFRDRWVRCAAGDDISANRMLWLEPSFLPALADRLNIDEWSYYLGFDPYKVSADTLAARLSHQLYPRTLLFETIARFDLIYILRVDKAWWEAYAANGGILRQLSKGWGGTYTDSDRWDADNPTYPGDSEPRKWF